MKKKTIISISIILVILILDQVLKIWIKTNMSLGESFTLINNFAEIYFVENPGMAFGMNLGGSWGKIGLSIFRLLAISGLTYFLIRIIKKQEHIMYIICISLIIAGATGNLLDSAFYGLIYNTGTVYDPGFEDWVGYSGISQFSSDGYSGALTGCVVDMLHFTVKWPSWVPKIGGNPIFRPIFNIADSAITISVFLMIIFYKKIFAQELAEKKKEETPIENNDKEV